MFCTNCGTEIPDGTVFCTNCGTSLASSAANTAASSGGAYDTNLGASLQAAVQANQDAIDSIEARAQAQVDAAFQDFPSLEDDAPEPPAAYDPSEAGVDQSAQAQAQAQSAPATVPMPAPVGVPVYQQDAYTSPNAHYSSQRSYDDNVYGQNGAQQPYQQPSYGNASSQPTGQPQQTWYPQPATSRAFAMVLYIAGLIGLIIALCVRDKNDAFITHHLNAVTVIFIGSIIGTMLTIIGIGFLILLYLFVMTILGMVYAYNGDMKELPLIGKIHIIS